MSITANTSNVTDNDLEQLHYACYTGHKTCQKLPGDIVVVPKGSKSRWVRLGWINSAGGRCTLTVAGYSAA
jgi:hypothetical protein